MAINFFYKFIIIMMLFSLSGCSQKIDRSELIGKYFANHGKAIDTIELKPDGTYIYYYNSDNGNILSYINRWTFDYENKEPRITFEKFIFGLPGYSIRGPGYWDVEVEKSWGKIRLCIDTDLNFYYEKKSN